MNAITVIRHATVLVELGGESVLVDPMLGDQHAYQPVEGTMNPRPWPLVGLPVPAAEVVARATAVLFSHTHVDHIDAVAIDLVVAAGLPVFCQPEDAEELRERGVVDVRAVPSLIDFGPLTIRRTGGRHGSGETAELMGPVSGFVIGDGSARVYIAGDTIWCPEVEKTLADQRPTVVVVNSGEARMEYGDPITMSADDVIAVAMSAPETAVVAVHLDALNHCGLSRADLAAATNAAGVAVRIPADGESLSLADL